MMGFILPFLNFSSMYLTEIGDKDFGSKANGWI